MIFDHAMSSLSLEQDKKFLIKQYSRGATIIGVFRDSTKLSDSTLIRHHDILHVHVI